MDFLDKPEEERAVYRERLAYEMDVILRMKYEGYFLIVSDFIKHAKVQGYPRRPWPWFGRRFGGRLVS